MYQTHKIYIKANMKMSGLILENPRLLLLMEHLEMDFAVHEKTVEQLCKEYSVPVHLFILFANLYNGFNPEDKDVISGEDIPVIIHFLKQNHNYYKTDKYPEIIGYIRKLQDKTGNKEVRLIEKFFTDYFNEVLEHLDYEDKVAFPYFATIAQYDQKPGSLAFSVKEYREHHTDIETKLTDLKNLLLKHINISDELSIRRKLILSLMELEYDLNIHSQIEEKILIPLVYNEESKKSDA
ncbi:MAG: hemerythrin domain-containing protein [Bacteroidales bacterium]|nr:hemerythrin domain-containing protein [Bacteroidales bacterium]